MQYVERIVANEQFCHEMEIIRREEEKRIYCRHDMEHLLAVARIAYLMSLEQRIHIERELIYVTALLHDIGRGREYLEGVPHEQASVDLAKEILAAIAYPEENTQLVLAAIAAHRGSREAYIAASNLDMPTIEEQLAAYIRKADGLSRNCFCCLARETCNWDIQRQNSTIKI